MLHLYLVGKEIVKLTDLSKGISKVSQLDCMQNQ